MISRTSPARPADPPLTVRARLPSPGSLTVSGNPGFNCFFTNGETKASYAICRARHGMKTTEITRKARTARAEGRMELGARGAAPRGDRGTETVGPSPEVTQRTAEALEVGDFSDFQQTPCRQGL